MGEEGILSRNQAPKGIEMDQSLVLWFEASQVLLGIPHLRKGQGELGRVRGHSVQWGHFSAKCPAALVFGEREDMKIPQEKQKKEQPLSPKLAKCILHKF